MLIKFFNPQKYFNNTIIKEKFSNKTNMLFLILIFLIGLVYVHKKILIYLLCPTYYASWISVLDYVSKNLFNSTGKIPFWENYQMCGLSYIVNAPFPFSITRIFSLLGIPPVFAFFLMEYILMTSGSVAFFFLMKKYGCKPIVSFIGTMLFLFWLHTWPITESYPMALAPLVFLFCEQYCTEKKIKYILFSAFSIGIVSSCGIIHGIAFVFLLQFLLVIFYLIFKIKKKYFKGFFVSWLFGLILALPTLLPQVIDANKSQRLFHDRYIIDIMNISIYGFLSKIYQIMISHHVPSILILTYIFFMISYFLINKRKNEKAIYFSVLFLIFIHLLLGFTQGLWKSVPLIGKLLNAFDLNRNLCAVGFGVTVMSTIGINFLMKPDESIVLKRKKIIIYSCIIGFLVSSAFFYFNFDFMFIVLLSIAFICLFLFIKSQKIKQLIIVLCAIFLGVNSLDYRNYNFYNYKPTLKKLTEQKISPISSMLNNDFFKNKYKLIPDENEDNREKIVRLIKESCKNPYYFRTIDLGFGRYDNLNYIANQIYTLFGMSNLYTARYYMFYLWLIDDLKKTNPGEYRRFSEWAAQAYSPGAKYNKNLLSLAGVKWIIAKNEINEKRFIKIITGEKYSLYRNDQVFPRAFPVFRLKLFNNINELSKYMINTGLINLKKAIPILKSEANGAENYASLKGEGRVQIVKYHPDEVIINVNYTKKGFLVLTDNFHRAWKVLIDNHPEKIYPAYYTFRMLKIPAGKHRIRFYFDDDFFIF